MLILALVFFSLSLKRKISPYWPSKPGEIINEKEFALKYGVYIDDGVLQSLHTRAVFIISKDGKIAYKQIVPDITHEPDYDKVLKAIEQIL